MVKVDLLYDSKVDYLFFSLFRFLPVLKETIYIGEREKKVMIGLHKCGEYACALRQICTKKDHCPSR